MSETKTLRFVSDDASLKRARVGFDGPPPEKGKPIKTFAVSFTPLAGTAKGICVFNLPDDAEKLKYFREAIKKPPLLLKGIRPFDAERDEPWEVRLQKAAGERDWIVALLGANGWTVDLDTRVLYPPDALGLEPMRARDLTDEIPTGVASPTPPGGDPKPPEEEWNDFIERFVKYKEEHPQETWAQLWKNVTPNPFTSWQAMMKKLEKGLGA